MLETSESSPGFRRCGRTKDFNDLVAPIHADPKRRAQDEADKQLILTALRLTELRAEAGLTQAQLAERLGTSQKNVSRIERAEDSHLSTISRYVEALASGASG